MALIDVDFDVFEHFLHGIGVVCSVGQKRIELHCLGIFSVCNECIQRGSDKLLKGDAHFDVHQRFFHGSERTTF